MLTKISGSVWLLAGVVALTYGHTLDVPFYLDDFSSIQENPVIYHWQGSLTELWQFAALRIVGYLTFALNYQAHQFQEAGYHVVNISIHWLAGVAVLGFMRGLVRTPLVTTTLPTAAKTWLPLVTALLFVLHPLQIQAVTYIVQRLASLAALFYISSLACFIQMRLAEHWKPRSLWLVATLLCALLGFFTKQNTATLPIAWLLLEVLLFPFHRRRLLFLGITALSGVTLLWIIFAWVFHQAPFSLAAMQSLTQETSEISRTAYLATQMKVLWTYIRLFFLPLGLHIDYDYPIFEGFAEVRGALMGHLCLLALAGLSARRWPLLTFGIGFYYLAHAVESSLIPIRDVIFEHRTYLPNLGLCILTSWLLVVQLPQLPLKNNYRTIHLGIIAILLTVLGLLTWQRNQLWRDPIALWQDNVKLAPHKQRGWIILGKHLIQAGNPTAGLEALNQAVTKVPNPDGSYSISVTTEAALNIIVAHKMLRHYEEALKWINYASANPNLRPFDRAKFLINQGNVFYEQGRYQEAETAYRQALANYPQNLKARINLASVLGTTGRIEEAMALYQEVLLIEPSNTLVKENLQMLKQLKNK